MAKQDIANVEEVLIHVCIGVLKTRVTAAELRQYFPPFKHSEIPRGDWSLAAAFKRRLEGEGDPPDVTIIRSSQRGRRAFGCALQLVSKPHYWIKIADNDPILLWDAVGNAKSPRLQLISTLTDEGKSRLEQLGTKKRLSRTEQVELQHLQEALDLERWHEDYQAGEFTPRVSKRYAHLAAD